LGDDYGTQPDCKERTNAIGPRGALATSTKLSRWEMTRINNTTFTVESFAKIGDKTPNYKASCKRD
jgi:hypothetical protein